jgi:hypothetical protein
MKRFATSSLLCVLALGLSVCVAYGKPGGLQRFRATIQASEVLTPTGQQGIFTVQIDGSGSGVHFGQLTFSATETVDFASSP